MLIGTIYTVNLTCAVSSFYIVNGVPIVNYIIAWVLVPDNTYLFLEFQYEILI